MPICTICRHNVEDDFDTLSGEAIHVKIVFLPFEKGCLFQEGTGVQGSKEVMKVISLVKMVEILPDDSFQL